MALEIERKFLLKGSPVEIFDTKMNIEQFYFKEEERYQRYRWIEEDAEIKIKKTIKTPISYGVWDEQESDLSEEEYLEKKAQRENISAFIRKIRYKKKVDDLIWEIDHYINITMIVAEVELPDIKHPVKIPDFIAKVLVKEVTGIKEFSNHNLGRGNYIY